MFVNFIWYPMARSKKIEFRTAFGAYISQEILGAGGAGIVHAATDEHGQPVAIKILDPSKATRDRLKRFKNEYLFGFRNQHKNLLRVLDFGIVSLSNREAPFYVMPRYTQSLRDLIASSISDPTRLKLFDQMLSGIEAAHLLNVVHRDLKPENILANEATDIVIADFGIAHFEAHDLYTAVETRNSERLANFMYAAPEQRRRGGTVDQRADIFALGLMLNELFTGVVPHGAGFRTVAQVRPELAWVDEVVASMIQSEPSARPGSIAEVRSRLTLHADQFRTRQKISALSQTVVPVGEVDDPLALEPPRITGVDYERGTLVIQLDKEVNSKWVDSLRNMGNYTSVMGVEPHRFQFQGNQARVSVQDDDAQRVIDYFKQWLPNATAKYRRDLEEFMRQAEHRERERIQAEREELERRERIRNTLRF